MARSGNEDAMFPLKSAHERGADHSAHGLRPKPVCPLKLQFGATSPMGQIYRVPEPPDSSLSRNRVWRSFSGEPARCQAHAVLTMVPSRNGGDASQARVCLR